MEDNRKKRMTGRRQRS